MVGAHRPVPTTVDFCCQTVEQSQDHLSQSTDVETRLNDALETNGPGAEDATAGVDEQFEQVRDTQNRTPDS